MKPLTCEKYVFDACYSCRDLEIPGTRSATESMIRVMMCIVWPVLGSSQSSEWGRLLIVSWTAGGNTFPLICTMGINCLLEAGTAVGSIGDVSWRAPSNKK